VDREVERNSFPVAPSLGPTLEPAAHAGGPRHREKRMTSQAVDLTIMDSQREPLRAELSVEPIPMGRRAVRALVRLGGCWALAVACVFVPLLHFVLVPGFLVLGPVLAYLGARATVLVKSEQVTCPRCAKATPVEPGTTGWPVRLWCASCGTTFFGRRVS